MFVLLFVAAPVATSTTQATNAGYASYQDIHGVTVEDIAAVEAIKKEYGAFTYGTTWGTECFMQENGTIGGFSGLFAEVLTELFGAKFTVELHDGWPTASTVWHRIDTFRQDLCQRSRPDAWQAD